MVKETIAQKKEFLHVKIDLPSFQFEVLTKDPDKALPELRKILETVQLDEQVIYEEFVVEEMRAALSETFVSNKQVMGAVKKLLKHEDDYRVARVEIATTQTIDFEHHTKNTNVQKVSIRKAILKLTEDVEPNAVKQGIIHINGDLSKDDKVLIVDHIHKCMPTAQLRAFQSSSSIGGNVLVECIFFGEFSEGDDEA
jgi:uncharacterized protein YqfB (UPF0267 family)